MACKEIARFSSVSSFCASSVSLSPSSTPSLSQQDSIKNIFLQLCPGPNFLSQLKQSPFSLRSLISVGFNLRIAVLVGVVREKFGVVVVMGFLELGKVIIFLWF